MKIDNGELLVNTDAASMGEFPYVGRIATLEFDRSIGLKVNSDPYQESSPTHYVVTKGPGGSQIVIGSGWLNTVTAKSSKNKGRKCFSFNLTYEGLPKLALNAWPDEGDPDRMYIEFAKERPDDPIPDSGEGAKSADPADDEIPF